MVIEGIHKWHVRWSRGCHLWHLALKGVRPHPPESFSHFHPGKVVENIKNPARRNSAYLERSSVTMDTQNSSALKIMSE